MSGSSGNLAPALAHVGALCIIAGVLSLVAILVHPGMLATFLPFGALALAVGAFVLAWSRRRSTALERDAARRK